MSASEESLALLRSIDGTLKALLALSQKRTAAVAANGNGNGAGIAGDRDLDGKHGDPEIKAADPRDWSGPSMKGRHMSQCPAEYLELLAERCDYFATKADEKGEKTDKGTPRSKYLRADAARARGWAQRIRNGWKPLDVPEDPEWAADPAEKDGW